MDLLKPSEQTDYMYNDDLRIIQEKDAFSFSLDTLLLGYFAQIKIHDNYRVVDLRSGGAAASIYMSCFNRAHYDAVGIQADVAGQAERSTELSKLKSRIEVHCLNALETPKKLGKDKYDMVIVNPPYFKVPREHVIDPDEKKALARHKLAINLEQIIKVSSDTLGVKGKMFMVRHPKRLGEIVHYCLESHLSMKWVQPFVSKRNADASLVVIKTVRNTANDGSTLRDAIVVHNQDGSFTPEIEQVISENKRQEKESGKENYYFYCLLCNDRSFYGGFTNDLEHRLEMHNGGKDAKYTKSRRPVKMVYHEGFDDKRLALKKEHWFEHRSRRWKEGFLKEHNVKF